MLIVGCGCRGRELARLLAGAGHAVRGTTRSSARLGEIEAAGAEGAVADPDRLGTLLPALEGVSCACLMAPAAPERLESLVDHLVDTPVRGVVCDGRRPEVRPVAEVGRRRGVPVELVDGDPGAWAGAVRRLL